jgi:fatty acid desaturase
VIVLWKRAAAPAAARRIWLAAAVLAVLYCLWAFVGAGAKSLPYAVALGAIGLPIHWWCMQHRTVANLAASGKVNANATPAVAATSTSRRESNTL